VPSALILFVIGDSGCIVLGSIIKSADNGNSPTCMVAIHADYATLSCVLGVVNFFYNGRLSCFFAGISTFLSFSIASALAMRFRVECGMMTSSM
jgi:hypothetical protein